jgi:hypothetical protein
MIRHPGGVLVGENRKPKASANALPASVPKLKLRTIRQQELLRRAGIDSVRVDRRSLGEIMNDEIPEARWRRQAAIMQRAGYTDYADFLTNWPVNEQT